MKQLLCFGDSNTWGLIPKTNERYPWGVRWTSILQEKLQNVRILEEGLCGRTTIFDDAYRKNRNGLESLPEILESNYPIDAAIIMLGTNDGFKIASEDLKLRGPGDMFGIRQSGSMIFKIGDVFADSACLVEAGKAADHILSEDPELKSEKYAFLGSRITAKLSENREQVIL